MTNNFIVEDLKKVLYGRNHLSKLILINAAVFLVLNIALAIASPATDETILRAIGLPAGILNSILHIWTYFTYMFVHEGFFHFLFNMLWLYWLGRILADIYGQNRVLILYIFGGLAGGLLYVLASVFPSIIPQSSFLIGASGGVLSVMVGTASLLPDYQLRLLFFGNVKLKYLALVGFILSTVLDLNANTGGKIAHVGGAGFGLLYGMQLRNGKEITDPIIEFFENIWKALQPKPKMKVVHKNTKKKSAGKRKDSASKGFDRSSMSDDQVQKRIDDILDKISHSGYDSLTSEEKDFLFKMSKR